VTVNLKGREGGCGLGNHSAQQRGVDCADPSSSQATLLLLLEGQPAWAQDICHPRVDLALTPLGIGRHVKRRSGIKS